MHAQLLSRVRLFATPGTVAHRAPLSMGFSRQEHWSGSPFPPLGDLPNPGIKLVSLASPALADGSSAPEPPGKQAGRPHGLYARPEVSVLSPLVEVLHLLKESCCGGWGGFTGNPDNTQQRQ